jgi:hypothetical protein
MRLFGGEKDKKCDFAKTLNMCSLTYALEGSF